MADDAATGAARREALGPTGSTRRCWTGRRPAPSPCTACRRILGEEITEGLLYGERQRIWDQAENRRHAQKALLETLVG
jgi:ornithine carbamoyltransferase